MKNIRLLLVEDDRNFMDLIKMLLDKIGVKTVAAASDSVNGWKEFVRFQPNICLIDIALGNEAKGGIELAKKIREQDTQVKLLFMTSYYTEENYHEVKLLKPNNFMNKELSSLKLKQAIELAWSGAKTPASRPSPVVSSKQAEVPKIVDGNYFFRVGDSFKAIDLSKVSFFYADGKMTFARIGNRNYATNVQLKVLEESLTLNFLRCHKKYLVNTGKITSINTKEKRIYLGEEALPIGYAYQKAFLNRLNLLK